MGTKFQTTGASPVIREVEILRETKETVTRTDGHKVPKVGAIDIYHDTWEDARLHILKMAEFRVKQARVSLQTAQRTLDNIKAMKP